METDGISLVRFHGTDEALDRAAAGMGESMLEGKEAIAMKVTKILVPVDYSDDSHQALQWGASLAKQYGAQLLLLHVIPKGTQEVPPEDPDWKGLASRYYPEVAWERRAFPPEPIIINLEERAQSELSQFAHKSLTEPVPVELKIAVGKPAEEILRVASEQGVDLIVMGTHGRTGLRYVLLGSVAERVARSAPCPVFTVRDGIEAAA